MRALPVDLELNLCLFSKASAIVSLLCLLGREPLPYNTTGEGGTKANGPAISTETQGDRVLRALHGLAAYRFLLKQSKKPPGVLALPHLTERPSSFSKRKTQESKPEQAQGGGWGRGRDGLRVWGQQMQTII